MVVVRGGLEDMQAVTDVYVPVPLLELSMSQRITLLYLYF